MKVLVTVAAFLMGSVLAASNAMAFPQVGDRSELAGTMVRQGVNYDVSLVIEMVGLNSSTGEFTQRLTQNIGGQAQVQEDVVSKQDVFTPAMAADILKNCASYGGTPQSLTVKAGTFATCALQNQTQDGGTATSWVGNVPFGAVKYSESSADGSVIEVSLVSYK